MLSLFAIENIVSFSGHCNTIAKVVVTFDGSYIGSRWFGSIRFWSIKEGNEEAVFSSFDDASQWVERYREFSSLF